MESLDNLLSTKDCEAILQNCLKQNNLKIRSHSVKPLSNKVEGFLGQHFLVTLQYEDKDDTLIKSKRYFMKVLNGSSKLIFEMSEALNAYAKEKFFYTSLLSEFDKYDIDTSYAPTGYFCKPYLLVLEDLSQRNFLTFRNELNFLDLDHCKIGLRTLAKFHASGILYESIKSKENGSPYHLAEQYPEMFKEMLFADDDNLASVWFKRSIEGISNLIQIIPDHYNVKKDEYAKLLAGALENNKDLAGYLGKFKGTILHGDLWFLNFLFKYDNEVVTDGVLLDYQLLKYGPPSVDVLHFLYTNTRKVFRDKHFEEMIDYYYKELGAYLPNICLETRLPKDQYLQLCGELQFIIKLQFICDRSITLLVDDLGPDVISNDETLKMYLLERRSEMIIECFNKNAAFKEVLGEDMLELYDMLVKS